MASLSPPLWFVTTTGATLSWALSDVCCDVCITQKSCKTSRKKEVLVRTCSNPQESCSCPNFGYKLELRACETKTQNGRLCSEQNALISGVVSFIFALLIVSWYDMKLAEVDVLDWRILTCIFAGCIHFFSYYITLRAFSSTDSTVITPLLQLSALWMLPLSALTSLAEGSRLIHPIHLCAVLLIVVGGFLPAANGNCSSLFSQNFWRQKCVTYCMLGEFLISLYNLLLHQCTYSEDESGALNAMTFFVFSRMGNSLACFLMYAFIPRLNAAARDLLDVRVRFAVIALLGEILSNVGVLIVTFGYSQFYEPSIVNAAEGGLQQLFNLLLALAADRYMPESVSSRQVENIHTKIISFFMVSVGLFLSQWELLII